jgi:hypothetical protein
MLPHYWKDACLLSPTRGPLRLDFYWTDLILCIVTETALHPIVALMKTWAATIPRPNRQSNVNGSGQECPLHTDWI